MSTETIRLIRDWEKGWGGYKKCIRRDLGSRYFLVFELVWSDTRQTYVRHVIFIRPEYCRLTSKLLCSST